MGQGSSNNKKDYYEPLLIERKLVSDPVIIMLGISGLSSKNNVRKQYIKINNESELYCLIRFVETYNSLIYNFEGNVKLAIMKNMYYNLRTDSLNLSDKLSDDNRRWFKPININSEELDKLANFIKI